MQHLSLRPIYLKRFITPAINLKKSSLICIYTALVMLTGILPRKDWPMLLSKPYNVICEFSAIGPGYNFMT